MATSIDYNDIFEMFLGQITDYSFVDMADTDIHAKMHGYIHKVAAQTYVSRLFSTITLDDASETLTFEMARPNNNSDVDVEFVKNMFTDGMVVEWVTPYVNKSTNISQLFGTKESNFYSQSSNLAQLRNLRDDVYLKFRSEIRDRGIILNDYISGE